MPATYENIATTTLTSAQATVTFSSISSAYTDLIIVAMVGNSDNANRDIRFTFNGDTGSNYSNTTVYGTGSVAASGRDTSQTYSRTNGSNNNTPTTSSIFQIMNYSNTTTNKTTLSRSNPSSWVVSANVHLWRSTSAINSISFTNENGANFVIGSTFTLYGIKAA